MPIGQDGWAFSRWDRRAVLDCTTKVTTCRSKTIACLRIIIDQCEDDSTRRILQRIDIRDTSRRCHFRNSCKVESEISSFDRHQQRRLPAWMWDPASWEFFRVQISTQVRVCSIRVPCVLVFSTAKPREVKTQAIEASQLEVTLKWTSLLRALICCFGEMHRNDLQLNYPLIFSPCARSIGGKKSV